MYYESNILVDWVQPFCAVDAGVGSGSFSPKVKRNIGKRCPGLDCRLGVYGISFQCFCLLLFRREGGI